MKAAIYCRLSEEDRGKRLETDDSESIRNQKSMLTRYAAEQGWDVYRIYSDENYAGADRNRPEFRRLLTDAKQHKFDIVLCKTQSRFTRELELVEKYIHGLFPLWKIRFVSIVDNADTADKGNKKSRQINGLVNEWYLEDMSENIRSVLTARRENGLHIGSFALYGYKKDPGQKGHLVVDEEAAAVVREVFALYADGYGKTAIARTLNDRGIPNPTEYKRLRGLRYRQPKSKNSTLWKYSAISAMLKNEIYIGNMVQGKYGSISYKTKINRPRGKDRWIVVPSTHEPIVSRELWDRVQSLALQKAKPFSTGEIGLFARKVHCMSCGYTLRSSKSHGLHYLQCPNRHVAAGVCAGCFISVDLLENAVLTELRRLFAEYFDRDIAAKEIRVSDGTQKYRAELEANFTRYQAKIDEYTKGIRDAYFDKVRGILTESDYTDITGNFNSEKKRLKYAAERCRQKLDGLAGSEEGNSRLQPGGQYTCPEHLTRRAVETLIDFIAVGRRDPKSCAIPVEIHWNF